MVPQSSLLGRSQGVTPSRRATTAAVGTPVVGGAFTASNLISGASSAARSQLVPGTSANWVDSDREQRARRAEAGSMFRDDDTLPVAAAIAASDASPWTGTPLGVGASRLASGTNLQEAFVRAADKPRAARGASGAAVAEVHVAAPHDDEPWLEPPPQPTSNPSPTADLWQTEEALRAALDKFQGQPPHPMAARCEARCCCGASRAPCQVRGRACVWRGR